MAAKKKAWWKSKTKVGSTLLAIGMATQAPGVAEVLPPEVLPWAVAMQAAGMMLAGFGMRNAVGENPAT